MAPTLFDPISYGSIEAKNRVVLSPLTRARSTRDGVPTDIMRPYYQERATMGLIICEATGINREGLGWPNAPGIWSQEQVEHWKPITEAVHANGGKIVCQLWHMGRVAHSDITGSLPLSCSATVYPTQVHVYDGLKKDPQRAREMTHEDIKRTISDYGKAAKNAIEAGFDGVEIHAANGYLIHEFMSSNANERKDEYNGTVENRLRFLSEVVDEVIQAIGHDRTGVRFSPNGESQGVFVADSEPVYTAVAELLTAKKIAFVCLRESSPTATFLGTTTQPQAHGLFRKHFNGKLVLNQDYTRETAIEAVEEGVADAISFGRATISNPDFYEKLRDNKPLTTHADEMKYWYVPGEKGYITWD